MIIVTIRIESPIRDMLLRLQTSRARETSKNDISLLLRKLVRLGVTIKENGGYFIESPLKGLIPLEDVEFEEESNPFRFYIEEELLEHAQRTFKDDQQRVLKKAIRLAIWSMSNLSDGEKAALLQSSEPYYSPVNFEQNELMEILHYLEPSNSKSVLIVTGGFGSGRTHLLNLVTSLLKDPQATASVRNPVLRKQIERLSNLYQVIHIGRFEEPREKLIEHLLGEPAGEKASMSDDELNTLIGKITPAQPLLVIYELITPNQLESIEFVYSKRKTKCIIESSLQVAEQLSKNKLGSTLTTIVLTSKPKIIKLELKPENKRNQESTNS